MLLQTERPKSLTASAETQHKRLRIAIGLATAGRPLVAAETLSRLASQTRPADAIIVSVPTMDDLASGSAQAAGARILTGTHGLTRQRNSVIEALDDFDIVCFIDDDFVLHADYLSAVDLAFRTDPNLVCATGTVVADGITGAGLDFWQADAALASMRPSGHPPVPTYNAYGCNMAFRMEPIRGAGLRFDERLPRYGWLEDVDFSRRIARFGGVARLPDALGVHLGAKSGRQSGRRFGYSQIANPIHLLHKGSYAWSRATWLMSRNIGMNLLFALKPEPHIDRRGRLAGNLFALRDLVLGRLAPERIETLP